MVSHVIVTIEESNHWSKDARDSGSHEKHIVNEWANEAGQAVIVSACLSLLSTRIDGEHDAV